MTHLSQLHLIIKIHLIKNLRLEIVPGRVKQPECVLVRINLDL